MALLETIRQKKKILGIVIGGALLAFIVEVGFEALGRQGNNSTAAKVGSDKIDFVSFNNRVQKESELDQQNGRSQNIDQATRQQQVLEEMIQEKLLEQEYEKVGITVTDNELTELIVGKNPVGQAVQFAQSLGVASPAELNKLLNDPKNNTAEAKAQLAPIRAQWELLQENIYKQYEAQKLITLVNGCIQANDLDRAEMEDEATISYITMVKKDFSDLADDKFPVSDEEIKAEWEKNKKMFAMDEETRYIHFIPVGIVPSKADINEAKKIADAAYAALQKGRGIDSVRVLGTVKFDTTKCELAQVAPAVKNFVQNAGVGSVMRDSTQADGRYLMYKLMAKAASLDSVKATMVQVPGAKSAQDSAMAMLKGGKAIADVTKAFKGAQAQEEQWMRIAMFADSVKNKFENAGADFVVLDSNENGAVFLKVLEKKAPKTFYTYATVSHEAYASTKTSNDLRDKLQKYLDKNKTVADFTKNAAAAGFQAMEEYITPSTPQLGMNPYTRSGIKDSRKAIKWAFDAKKGEVSGIFADNNDILIAVCLDDIYDGDYMPATHPGIKNYLTDKVRAEKKGEARMKEFNGKAKDLNGYANVMKVKVDTVQVAFGNDRNPMLEPSIIGRVAAAQKGQFVGLLKGKTGVYAFHVENIEKSALKLSKQDADMRFAQTRGAAMVSNMLIDILRKGTKVERRLIEFY